MMRARWAIRSCSTRRGVAVVEFVLESLTRHSRQRRVQSASARNRRDEENAIAFLESAGFPAQEADVFLVEIDIKELADLPLVVANMAAESREAGSKLVEGFRPSFASRSPSKASRRGARSSVAENSAARVPVVYRPLPVMQMRVVSYG